MHLSTANGTFTALRAWIDKLLPTSWQPDHTSNFFIIIIIIIITTINKVGGMLNLRLSVAGSIPGHDAAQLFLR